MSIFGCFLRGLWYFIFSIVVWKGRPIESHSRLCQTSGFFINLGNEVTGMCCTARIKTISESECSPSADFAILFIAIHGALQIFKPAVATWDGQDGIYKYRKHAYVTILVLPLILSTLPFVNKNAAYTTQTSVFCALPMKPIWIRLVLVWIPRFIIGFVIAGLAIAVYVHVEIKFRGFSASQRSSRTSINLQPLPITSKLRPSLQGKGKIETRTGTGSEKLSSLPILRLPQYDQEARTASRLSSGLQSPKYVKIQVKDYASKEYFPQNFKSDRKQSSGTGASIGPSEKSAASLTVPPPSWMTSRLPSSDSALEPAEVPPFKPSDEPSSDPAARQSVGTSRRVSIEEPGKQAKLSGMRMSPPSSEAQSDSERKALKKQLRLIFVYPIVYVVLWTPPSIINIMMFFSAAHLPTWLTILSTLCLTLMGGVDCAVFLWREKPWRIPEHRHWIRNQLRHCPMCRNNADLESLEYGSSSTSLAPSLTTNTSGAASRISRTIPDGEEVANALSNIQLPPKSRPPQPPRSVMSHESHGGSSKSLARKHAYERLALEIKDRRNAKQNSISTRGSKGSAGSSVTGEAALRKEWWDRNA
jgi:hypothetical protein